MNQDLALSECFPLYLLRTGSSIILKNIPPGNEARYIQLQAEMFNVFSHTQYLAIDDAARFDPAGNQVNARFGQVTAVRPPRYIQVGLTLYF